MLFPFLNEEGTQILGSEDLGGTCVDVVESGNLQLVETTPFVDSKRVSYWASSGFFFCLSGLGFH